jgi:hypothetical protein
LFIRNRQEWCPGENGSKGIGTENGKMERLVKMVTVKQMKIIKTKELSKVFDQLFL